VEKPETLDAAHLERERVAGAIKTDFILSAEIMTIALSAIEAPDLVTRGIVLAAVAVAITAVVYGTVALLVKADDIGLKLSQVGRFAVTRWFGRSLVKGMPTVLAVISAIGTGAMLWVAGSILVHGLADLGYPTIYKTIKGLADAAGTGFIHWLVTATLDGLVGLAAGLVLLPVVNLLILPIAGLFQSAKKSESST
jgi:hypothetical protein